MKPKLLTTLPSYTRRLFVGDLFAGISVALVAIPLSIAIAIASGAPPATGLVTAIVGGFLISALGGSRVQIGGEPRALRLRGPYCPPTVTRPTDTRGGLSQTRSMGSACADRRAERGSRVVPPS